MANQYELTLKLGAREMESEARRHFPACLSAWANSKCGGARGQGGSVVG